MGPKDLDFCTSSYRKLQSKAKFLIYFVNFLNQSFLLATLAMTKLVSTMQWKCNLKLRQILPLHLSTRKSSSTRNLFQQSRRLHNRSPGCPYLKKDYMWHPGRMVMSAHQMDKIQSLGWVSDGPALHIRVQGCIVDSEKQNSFIFMVRH